ncbi:hypothetical protein Q8W71_10370 [Methylobacterium sp. NEAU 140]|uniref:hypothetical protein n=1 Tax=Methylobacterium sp. NEAU 140 TaxID=3064945 RepID=UPI002736186C|nr:hypothetical protein [Methylobacterium sp. NEAU 140]MDP4023029.1 hypothetical protein [Methylobacterium sp. NEAU 140]
MRAATARMQTDAGARRDAKHAADAHAFFSRHVAEMPPVAPIASANDDPLAGVTVSVERALRAAGHLR